MSLSLEQIADRVITKVKTLSLPKPVSHPVTTTAQKYLDAANRSVENALLNMRLAREFDKAYSGKKPSGRLYSSEIDMLRAAVVFAGAGLDASLKELIRKALPHLSTTNDMSRRRFQQFTERHLGLAETAIDKSTLASVLVDPVGPRASLLERYIRALAGDSLQSSQQVGEVCSALGIDNSALRKRVQSGGVLDAMFRARNQIVHEFDLTPKGSRPRTIDETTKWVVEALSVGQEIINVISGSLSETGTNQT
jgi:hypothetical protein